jgi:hypothetical protein
MMYRSRSWNGAHLYTAVFLFAAVVLRGTVAGAATIASSLTPLVHLATAAATTPALAKAPAAEHSRATRERHGSPRAARCNRDLDDRVGLTASANGSDQGATPARLGKRRSAQAFAAVADPLQAQERRRQRDETRQILRL